jgi:hypothetical protein
MGLHANGERIYMIMDRSDEAVAYIHDKTKQNKPDHGNQKEKTSSPSCV